MYERCRVIIGLILEFYRTSRLFIYQTVGTEALSKVVQRLGRLSAKHHTIMQQTVFERLAFDICSKSHQTAEFLHCNKAS
jgi:hypothetical protein